MKGFIGLLIALPFYIGALVLFMWIGVRIARARGAKNRDEESAYVFWAMGIWFVTCVLGGLPVLIAWPLLSPLSGLR
jgi:hypothetical protein